jgi:SHS2 domain-containing protein
MRRYEISDRHTTADIGLEITGDSLEQLFVAGAEGMMAIIMGERPSGPVSERYGVTLKAGDMEQLLVDWLSELLYRFDADGLIPLEYRVKISSSPTPELAAEVGCCHFRPGIDRAEHEVKAVTYYKMKVREIDGGYGCHVVFDL